MRIKNIIYSALLLFVLVFVFALLSIPMGNVLNEFEVSYDDKLSTGKLPLVFEKEGEFFVELKTQIDSLDEKVLVIPKADFLHMSIFINDFLVEEFGARKNKTNSQVYSPVRVSLPTLKKLNTLQENILRIVIYGKDYISLGKTPYIAENWKAGIKLGIIKFLYYDIFLLVGGISLFLFYLGFLFADNIKVDKKAFKYFSLAFLLNSLSIIVEKYGFMDNLITKSFSVQRYLSDDITVIAFSLFLMGLYYLIGKQKNTFKYSIIALAIFTSFIGIFWIDILSYSIFFMALIMLFLIRNKKLKFCDFSITFLFMTILFDFVNLIFKNNFEFLSTTIFSYYGIIAMVLSFAHYITKSYKETYLELESATNQLQASNEEMKAMNEELEASYKEIDSTLEKFQNLIDSTTMLIEAAANPEADLLPELLQKTVDLIPEADYGSVSTIDGEEWNYVHTIGHDIEKLKQISFKRNYFIDPKTSNDAKFFDSNVFLVEKVHTINAKMPNDIQKKFKDAVKGIKESIIVQLEINNQTIGHLCLDIAQNSERKFTVDSLKVVGALGSIASAFLAFKKLSKVEGEFQKEIILSIIHMMEIHDQYTKGHSEEVARLSTIIAQNMGYSKSELKDIHWAGLVHDIGKILIPKEILNKPSRLNDDEFVVIKMHPVWGHEVLCQSRKLENIAIYARHHHERWDGRGYPDSLIGEEIPMISRIIGVADTWDAMTRDRAYRKALSHEVALDEIKKNSGKQFDPLVAELFVELYNKGEFQKHISLI